ncbi:MAG: hypothetical protein AB7U05_04800 [Mangrovibacterium sp.]
MEKKIIHFNEQDFNRQKSVFLSNSQILNDIADEYTALGIGKISPERVQEIFSGKFGSIEAALSDAIEKEAKNSLVREVFKKGVFERFENFQTKVGQLAARFEKNQSGALGIVSTPLGYFSIQNGKFEITNEIWQKIKDERCSNFISTEQEQKIHDALQALAVASNDFMSSLGEGVKLRYFPPNEPSDFLILGDNGFEPDPETDYKFLTQ